MSLWLAAVIIVGAAAVAVTGMLLVRRVAPPGTYFKDAVPAGALYTVVGTAYMVILAFVFLVAFESYQEARSEAQAEATATLAMFHSAQVFNSKATNELQGQVMCYAREVISKEWPAMRDGKTSSAVEARIAAMESEAEEAPIADSKQTAAYGEWASSNQERRRGRQGRISEAAPVVAPVIWLILIIGAVTVIATVCFFADREEAWLPQATMIAAITTVVVSGLLLVRFLDKPYENQSGSIKPTAMARSLALMQQVSNGQTVRRCG
jgi:Protein of unknown function (DUF4239)